VRLRAAEPSDRHGARFREQARRLGSLRHVDDRLGERHIGSGPDDRRRNLPPGDESEARQHHRLSRAGLARDDRQTRGEGQSSGRDDTEVLD